MHVILLAADDDLAVDRVLLAVGNLDDDALHAHLRDDLALADLAGTALDFVRHGYLASFFAMF